MHLDGEYEFSCPYCGSPNSIGTDSLEPRTLLDCEVCCRPISLIVRRKNGDIYVDVRKENE